MKKRVDCGKTLGLFNLRATMAQDWANYEKELQKQCPGCSILQAYGSQDALNDHIKSHHSEKKDGMEDLRNGLRRLI